MACKGKTNKLTLYPCCAVIKSSTYDRLTFPEGCESGMILAKGDIDVANNVLRGDEEFDYYGGEMSAISDSEGNNYFVIPMANGVVNVKISFESAEMESRVLQNACNYEGLYQVRLVGTNWMITRP